MTTSRSGIGSVANGIRLLEVLAASPVPLSLKALALQSGMPASKAHKYLASYIQGGLVRQGHSGGAYDLGPLALELGLAAMRRLDVVEMAQSHLDDLREQSGVTAALAVWANFGPAIVRRADSPEVGPSSIRLGTVLPLLSSAIGLIFAAYLDRRFTLPFMRKELDDPLGLAQRAGVRTLADIDARLAGIREARLAVAEGIVDPGRSAIAAPIFDHTSNLAAAVAAIGVQGRLETDASASQTRSVTATAVAISKLLGAPLNRR